MIDFDALARHWRSLALHDWVEPVETLVRQRMSTANHGDFERWQAVIESLPDIENEPDTLQDALLTLAPWRKGPFEIGKITIDAEWRSDLKWERLVDAVALQGKNVLDVGCGNGYYALRMREAGAASVTGVDPTLLYVMQFLAVNFFVGARSVAVLPLRLHELPGAARCFDIAFSMGVLYHQRSPIDHLRELRQSLRTGGQLLLETLFLPGDEPFARTPVDRYARMKNVWLLPTTGELTTWLQRAGYRNIEIVDESMTTTAEQRATDWMRFESLADALDPNDASLTIEGWPAPRRVVITAISP